MPGRTFYVIVPIRCEESCLREEVFADIPSSREAFSCTSWNHSIVGIRGTADGISEYLGPISWVLPRGNARACHLMWRLRGGRKFYDGKSNETRTD